MIEKLKISFPLPVLVREGGLIINAAEKYSAPLGPRLQTGQVTEARTLAGQITAEQAKQKSDAGDRGTLTREQNGQFEQLLQRIANARETAKNAFKGQDVKLHEEFQVGMHKPTGLSAELGRGRIIVSSLRKPANQAALQKQGWLESDTQALDDAIAGLAEVDDAQEAAKPTPATNARNHAANLYYDAVLALQNMANLQWPERVPANAAIRAEFRLGIFPPSDGSDAKKPTPPPPPPAP